MSDRLKLPTPEPGASSPPTSELKAFAGMVAEPGCRPRARRVHDELIQAISTEWINCQGDTPLSLELCAGGAKALRNWSLELIRLIQAGITREQLVDLLQWSALQGEREAAELKSLLADAASQER